MVGPQHDMPNQTSDSDFIPIAADPLFSQLLGEWVPSSPVAHAKWYNATEVAQLPVIRNKRIEAVAQYASVLLPAPDLIGLLMDLNVPKGGFRHVSEFMTH